MDRLTPEPLPVHGFVLAGGKSSRMGRDKALVELGGRPMVAFAVSALRFFCAAVSIAGNRSDLEAFAPVVPETRVDVGPAAGIEAGLRTAVCDWTCFVPVDVPRVPAVLLRRWTNAVLARAAAGVRLSYLEAGRQKQPAFCALHTSCLAGLSRALDDGERRLEGIYARIAEEFGKHALWVAATENFRDRVGPEAELEEEECFANVNTPEDLSEISARIRSGLL